MEITSLPPVFRDFSVGRKSDTELANAQGSLSGQNAQKQKLEVKKIGGNITKVTLGLVGSLALVSYLIPLVRHKKFNLVNPNFVDKSQKFGEFKKGFIKFSDNLEVRRDLIVSFVVDKLRSVKMLIRKNFFSYNQSNPEKHVPMSQLPEFFVRSVIKNLNDFVVLCRKIGSKIEIDYTDFTKS